MRRIKELRSERGLSQIALARQAGIEPAVLCRIETGKASPNVRTLHRIADALSVDTAELFQRTGELTTIA